MAITEISVSKIYVLATEPTNKVKDRFWFDTTNNLLKRYDGTSWKPISASSDDVVVLSSGNKVSLTNYLNTQIAALAEGIDSKQDKLAAGSNINIASDNTISVSGLTKSSVGLNNVDNTSDANKPISTATQAALDKKQDKLTKYAENTDSATIDFGYIFDDYNFQIIGKYIQLYDADFKTNYKQKSIEVTEAYEGAGDTTFEIKNNTKISGNLNYTGILQKNGVDVLASKQNSTDTTLNTTDKTIVGAINELLASINANVITSTEQKRITTTSSTAGIQMSTTAKACMVSINPVKTNVGAIYISTSSDTAPTINPLYPDQMPKYKFPDASQVYIWSDVNGDSVDLTIEYYG